MWKDYDPEDQSTWTVMEAPSVDRAWEERLTTIGGLNPFGQPMLMWRWGATYVDPMGVDGGLKYWIGRTEDTLQGFAYTDPETGKEMVVKRESEVPHTVLIAVPKYGHIDLGQRRIIIENWRSAEFLAASKRYQDETRRDPDTKKEFFFCKACNAELVMGHDGPAPCAQCGSKRHYVREAVFEGDGRLLNERTAEGCYDCFMILENGRGEPMEADGHALELIEAAWRKHTTQTMREQITEMLDDIEPQQQLMREATSPTNPFMAPAIPGW